MRNYVNQSKRASLHVSSSWARTVCSESKGFSEVMKVFCSPSWKHSVLRKLIGVLRSTVWLVTWNVVCNNPEPQNRTAAILKELLFLPEILRRGWGESLSSIPLGIGAKRSGSNKFMMTAPEACCSTKELCQRGCCHDISLDKHLESLDLLTCCSESSKLLLL